MAGYLYNIERGDTMNNYRPMGGMGPRPMGGFGPGHRPNANNRFIGGGFLGPFVLGGITGGLLAPSFYPRPYPIYPPYQPYYPFGY